MLPYAYVLRVWFERSTKPCHDKQLSNGTDRRSDTRERSVGASQELSLLSCSPFFGPSPVWVLEL